MTVSRITIDIDSYHRDVRMRVLRAYHGLQNLGATDVKVAVSSSGKGFHVVGYFDRHIPTEEKFNIRENLNDDPNRLKMDRERAERGLPTQTMWSKKEGNDGERYVYDTAEEALQHVEATSRSPHERMNTLQNHGRKALRDTEIPHTKLLKGA